MLKTYFADFLDGLKNQKRQSPHTLKAYQRDLVLLERFVFEKNPTLTVEKVDSALIRHALANLRRENLSARSIARVLSSWRAFFRYLLLKGVVASNPTSGLHAPKADKHLPSVLSVDETMALLDFQHESHKEWVKKRDQAMFELLYSSGMRLAELHSLNVEEASNAIHNGTMRVLGKRQKMREVPVGQSAVKALTEWLPLRNLLSKNDPALFLNQFGTRLHYRTIAKRLDSYAKEVLPQHVHPHMLRHTFASHLLQSSGNLRAVQEFLGHASLDSTQIYTHLDFQQLAKVYDGAHPRAHRKDNE